MKGKITKLPFNAKKALAGHPLITRDGQMVSRFECSTWESKNKYPYVAEINGETFSFYADGFYYDGGEEDSLDLFLLVEEAEGDKKEDKLVPFDLFKAKCGEEIVYISDTAKVKYPAKFIAHVPETKEVVALLEEENTSKHIYLFVEDGTRCGVQRLFMAPKVVKHKVWVNLYSNGLSYLHSTKESSEINRSEDLDGFKFIECREIEWEGTK